jgi:hypothetical protein
MIALVSRPTAVSMTRGRKRREGSALAQVAEHTSKSFFATGSDQQQQQQHQQHILIKQFF